MFRNRLKGGHRVGATNTLQPHTQHQSATSQQVGGWGMPQPHYGTPMQPGQPPPQQPVQQQLHQHQAASAGGWGNDGIDNSWDWGETDSGSKSSAHGLNSHQQPSINQQQQSTQHSYQLNQQTHQLNQQPHQLNQQPQHAFSHQHSQPPVPQYNQNSDSSLQQLQHTSQQQYTKATQNAIHSNLHDRNSPGVFPTSQSQPPLPTNAEPQYVNGNTQNGNGNTDDWGDNWGNDWAQAEVLKNNNNPASYGNQDQESHQQVSNQHGQHEYHSQQPHYQSQQQLYQQQGHSEMQHHYQQDVVQQQQNVHQHQQYEQLHQQHQGGPQPQQQLQGGPQPQQQHQVTPPPQQQHQVTPPPQQQHLGAPQPQQQHQVTPQLQQHHQATHQPQQQYQGVPPPQHQHQVTPQPQQQYQGDPQLPPQHQVTPQLQQQQQHVTPLPQQQHQVTPQPQQQHQVIPQQQHQGAPQLQQHHQGAPQQYQSDQESHQYQVNHEGYYQQPPGNDSHQYSSLTQQQDEQVRASPAVGEDAWGWDNDDWDASKQEEEQKLNSHQGQPQSLAPPPQPESSFSNALVQDVAPTFQHELAPTRESAGDGWPDMETVDQQDLCSGEQQAQLTDESLQPAIAEQALGTQQDENQTQNLQQNSQRWDDGLIHGEELGAEAGTEVYSSDVMSHVPAQVYDPTTVTGHDSTHSKEDSSGWEGSEFNAGVESMDAIVISSNVAAVENTIISDGREGGEELQVPDHTDQSTSDETCKANHVTQASLVDSIGVPASNESQAPSTTSGTVMVDTWDDDGWGDGWEAETSAVQEATSVEENAKTDQFENPQDQATSGYSQGSSVIHQTTSEQSYHSGGGVSEAYKYYENPQNQVQEGGTSAWQGNWNPDAAGESHGQDATAGKLVESVTQDMEALSFAHKEGEELRSLSSSYGQYGEGIAYGQTGQSEPSYQHSDQSEVPSYHHTGQTEPAYQHSGQPGQPQAYHMPQENTHAHAKLPLDKDMPVYGTESHQWPPTVEEQNRAEQHPQDGLLTVQSQAGHESSPVPEPSSVSHSEDLSNVRPSPVPSPRVDTGHTSLPQSFEAPYPPTQDPVQHYLSFQPNQQLGYQQYQGLNQEIVEESTCSNPEIPDPMMSRIPDGASSVSELPVSTPVATDNVSQSTEEPQAEGRNSAPETSDRPSSTQSAQSVGSKKGPLPPQTMIPPSTHAFPERPSITHTYPERPPSTHAFPERPPSTHAIPDIPPSTHAIPERPPSTHAFPERPPSTHAFPERPASNQSAHSVHSVRSTHSVHSAYSNRSTQSSHSLLSQNQEVPPSEEAKLLMQPSTTYQSVQPDHSSDEVGGPPAVGPPSHHVPSANHRYSCSVSSIQESATDGGLDPMVPSANNPVAPPMSGPLGTVTSLRARKGSPFQPVSGNQGPDAVPISQVKSQFPASVPNSYPDDVSANLEMTPDNNEQLVNANGSVVPLWTGSENLTSNVKLAVAAAPLETASIVTPPTEVRSSTTDASNPNSSNLPPVTTNPIPLVVPGMIKDEPLSVEHPATYVNAPQAIWAQPDPPAAHNVHPQQTLVLPRMQTTYSSATSGTPGVLDLSRSSRNSHESRGDGSQNKTETPNFSRMVPGESSKGESASTSTYQAPSVVPSMPSERVVTGNDNPQPVLPVRIKQEPAEVRSPPDGPYTSDLSGQGASVVPPVRSETIGSEEPTARNFASVNSGSRPDLTSDHRDHRGDRGGGRWERDHSRDRDSRSSDRYRDRSREHNRDYYRDDSPHSRRSYDRDYDHKYDSDRRAWRHESEDEEEHDRRYYESRDRRDRAYRDELDRYSDRPIKEEKDRSHRESSRDKRGDYRDRSRDYKSYDDDPYYGRSDRSQPVSRSSSINNLDNEGDRSGHTHRSRHDYYDRHDHRDSRTRDKDGSYPRNPRDRDSSFSQDGRDPRRDPRYYVHRGYDESYGSREVYDYYYQYYRDHPYYKEYYRQWMKQYGQAYPSHESFYDDRTSIHSGRSSVNDELKKSVSSGELSGVPSVGGDSASEAPQRLTPVQYGRPHINARFTPGGQLLFVLPKDPRDGEKAIVQLRDVQKMLCMDPSLNRCVRQMKSYPGPLTLGDTHKDVVIKYCELQAVEAARNQALPDGESVTLIWEYLALLVKQNGKLHGSDVAGLLLKGQERMTQPPSQPSSASQLSPDALDAAALSDGSPQDEGIDVQSQSMPLQPARDEAALLKKFTEYLCLGRKKEAVDYAMREGLWGHALALSYKMDSTTHTRVLAAFSNAIPRNDVLLTLFQQLSGKRPEVTKSYAPQQWGDWRQHLAMMVSNPTGQNQRDKASILSLGDTLASRGQLHAAHFCYLVAEAEWGCFSSKESKLVLIGSSHMLPFQAFATNEAIQCTEVFEFARSLDSSNPVLDKFQSYKLVYALRLAEFGFPSEALRYCDVISQIVRRNPQLYQGDFLSQVYQLGLRLKYHDLHYQMHEGEMSEMPDPQWLTNLSAVVATIKQQELEEIAAAAAQAGQGYEPENQGYPPTEAYRGSRATPDMYPPRMRSTPDAYQQGYGGGDTTQQQQNHGTPDPYQGQESTGDGMDGRYAHQHIPTYPPSPVRGGEGIHAPVPQNNVGPTSEDVPPPQVNTTTMPPQSEGGVPMMMQPQSNQYAAYGGNYWPGYPPQDPNASSQYMQPGSAEMSHSSLPPSPEVNTDQQHSNSVTSMSQPNSLSNYPPSYQQPYQPWDQQQQDQNNHSNDQSQSTPLEPTPTVQRTPEEEAYWAEMSGKKTSSEKSNSTLNEKDKSSEDRKTQSKDSDPYQDKASGWSISSLFGWKKSKQAVLPDDKNPSIVWNEEKKRWENKDGEEEVNSPPPPPPKFALGGPGAPPITMSRVGPRKSRYINTEKSSSKPPNGPNPSLPPLPGGPLVSGIPPMPSGSPLPGAHPMPAGAPTPPMFMVPGSMPQPQEGGEGAQQPQPDQQAHKPLQMPNTSLPDPSLMRRSRYISESSIELEEDSWPPANTEGTLSEGNEGGGSVPMMAPPGQPQFFNPTQFNPASAPPNQAQTRRVGPGKRLYQGKR